jgi:hypothetical protein
MMHGKKTLRNLRVLRSCLSTHTFTPASNFKVGYCGTELHMLAENIHFYFRNALDVSNVSVMTA